MRRARDRISRIEALNVAAFAAWTTLATFLFSYFGYQVLQDKKPPSLLALWSHWDTGHFLSIIRGGYVSEGENVVQIVFFPLYPYLVRALTPLIPDPTAAALILSNLCYLGCAILLYRLARLERSPVSSFRTVFLFSIFPTAYFLHGGYSESLFLLLAIGSLYFARRSRWGGCATLAALCTFTRITGLALLPALLFEYFHQRVESRAPILDKKLAWLTLAPSGFLAYLGINWSLHGDPLQFLEFQRTEWFKQPGPAWKGLQTAWDWGFTQPPRNAVLMGGAEWVFTLGALTLVVLALFRTRLSYAIFALGSWLIVTSTSYWQSEPRYALSLFPIFLVLSDLTRRPAALYSVSMIFLLFHALFLGQFIQGSWAF